MRVNIRLFYLFFKEKSMSEAEEKKNEHSAEEKAILPKIQTEVMKEYASPACSYPEFSDDFEE